LKIFACNVCNDRFDQPSKAKHHITIKHLKPEATKADPKAKREREDDDAPGQDIKR
jgi:hypothetical protein